MRIKRSIAIAAVFIWTGFVCAISFMEAWLKFRAPGVTLPIGLGIGRLVFSALNKVEWVLLIVSIICLFPLKKETFGLKIAVLVLLTILLIQTFWMLPVLDARAELHIAGSDVPHSNLHFYYIAAECIKVVVLFIAGINIFSKKNVETGAKIIGEAV